MPDYGKYFLENLQQRRAKREAESIADLPALGKRKPVGLSGYTPTDSLATLSRGGTDKSPFTLLKDEYIDRETGAVNKSKFTEDLRDAIYGDVSAQDMYKQKIERLPEIFNRMFKGEASWETKNKLNSVQRQYWKQYVKNYDEQVRNDIVAEEKQRSQTFDAYKNMFEDEVSQFQKIQEAELKDRDTLREATKRAAQIFSDVTDPDEWRYRRKLFLNEYGDRVGEDLSAIIPEMPNEEFKEYVRDAALTYKEQIERKDKLPKAEKDKRPSKESVYKRISTIQEKISKLETTGTTDLSGVQMDKSGVSFIKELLGKGDITGAISALKNEENYLRSLYPEEFGTKTEVESAREPTEEEVRAWADKQGYTNFQKITDDETGDVKYIVNANGKIKTINWK